MYNIEKEEIDSLSLSSEVFKSEEERGESILNKLWYIEQTERILRGEDKREEEIKENNRTWSQIKREYQIYVKKPYIDYLRREEREREEEREEEINEIEREERVKDFAFSEVNLLYSLRIEKRITRELNEIEEIVRIGNKNRLTDIFFLFNLLEKNQNRDIQRKYIKEERERLKRVRENREKRRVTDKTRVRNYDYTVSSQKLHEDRNTGANHNTPKRTLKQIEVKALQYKALLKTQKILRELKRRNIDNSVLKSVTIYAGEVIGDSEPAEVMNILNDLQKDVFREYKEEREDKTEIEDLKRYIEYSERLNALRTFGVSFKLLVNKEKREVKEMVKEREERRGEEEKGEKKTDKEIKEIVRIGQIRIDRERREEEKREKIRTYIPSITEIEKREERKTELRTEILRLIEVFDNFFLLGEEKAYSLIDREIEIKRTELNHLREEEREEERIRKGEPIK